MTGLLQRCFSFDPSERPGFGRITKEVVLDKGYAGLVITLLPVPV